MINVHRLYVGATVPTVNMADGTVNAAGCGSCAMPVYIYAPYAGSCPDKEDMCAGHGDICAIMPDVNA